MARHKKIERRRELERRRRRRKKRLKLRTKGLLPPASNPAKEHKGTEENQEASPSEAK